MESIDWVGGLLKVTEPWNSWKGLLKRFFYIFLGITVLDIALAIIFNKVFNPPVEYRPLIFLGTYFLPFFIYFSVFLANRAYSAKIILSKKYNLVLAYNLESLNDENFKSVYDNLVNEIRNELNFCNLGDQIRVVVCPPDIKIKNNTAAEAKTVLGLPGATILVSGNVTKRRLKYKFKTKFSYEFEFPVSLGKKKAKEIFSSYIEGAIMQGLFSNEKLTIESFSEQLLPTTLFILMFSASTMKSIEKCELFFEGFKNIYKGCNILRKKELGPSFREMKELMEGVYIDKLNLLTLESLEKITTLETGRIIAEKLLIISPKNYQANLLLSYYYEHMADTTRSVFYHNVAVENAKKGEHAHLFNQAYFALMRGDYKLALDIYEEIPDITSVNTSEVSEDLNRAYKNTKKPALLFAEAYVTFRWEDEATGRTLLHQFEKLLKIVPNLLF